MAARVPYETFNGARVKRVPHPGRRIALLADREDLDPGVVARILEALDRAAEFYASMTGREPKPNRLHEGRITVAEVEGIGGAAWAYLGETGIEIQPGFLDVMYRAVRDEGLFDQPLFYELGRNYWLYERTLDVHPGSVATGYAVYMRFLAMDAAGVRGAPYYGWTFDEFRARVESLLDVLVARGGPDWTALLAQTPVAVHTFEERGRTLPLSTADLIAALFAKLSAAHGRIDERGIRANRGESAGRPKADQGRTDFFRRFLRAADSLPRLVSHVGIADNILRAASTAAGADLTDEFRAWRWPIAARVS